METVPLRSAGISAAAASVDASSVVASVVAASVLAASVEAASLEAASVEAASEAVSYTHLDVYKRQGYDRLQGKTAQRIFGGYAVLESGPDRRFPLPDLFHGASGNGGGL